MRNYLGLLALLIFSSPVFAADYYFIYGGNNYPSAGGACSAHQAANQKNYPSNPIRSTITLTSGTNYSCKLYFVSGGGAFSDVNFSRFGDSCPSGATWDAAKGQCNAPYADQGKPCPDQSGSTSSLPMVYDKGGQCVRLDAADQETTCKHLGHISLTKKRVPVRGTINDQGEAVPPPSFKSLGCAADVNASTAQCTIKPASMGKSSGGVTLVNPATAVCTVDVVFNGQVANNITPENLSAEKNDLCLDETKCNLPEPQKSSEKKPCTYVGAPDGSQTCVSTSAFATEGKSQCGTVNGKLVCSDSLAKAIGNGIIVWTKVNSEGLGDGKTKVTKTDTMTSYTCGSGKSTCTSSDTTNTTITIKDGNGNTESVTGTCTGKACPDKNTNPDGDGDGFGDCTGGDCSQEEGGSPDLPGMGEVDSYQVTTQKFYDRVNSSPIASSVSNISVPSGGSAPDFATGGLEALGGVSLDFSIIGTLFDGVKSILSAVMKAFWCFVAVFIFLNA